MKSERGQRLALILFHKEYAKMFILNGEDVFRLQKTLGHKSIDNEDYKLSRSTVKRAIADLEQSGYLHKE
jgi:hypothetical protein